MYNFKLYVDNVAFALSFHGETQNMFVFLKTYCLFIIQDSPGFKVNTLYVFVDRDTRVWEEGVSDP